MASKFKKIAQKFNLKLIILFGSLAKNIANTYSDADIAVLQKKKLSLKNELLLRKEFFNIFKKEIDLVFLQSLGPLMLGQIAKDGKLLYGDEKEFKNFKIYAAKTRIDFEPYFKLQEKLIKKQLLKKYA